MPVDILVIDNDQSSAEAVKGAFEPDGHLVLKASSADIGLTMAKRVRPTLVFVNLAIPGANGLEICKTIHQTLSNTPIFLLTVTEGKFHPSYKTLYGIEGYFKKPLSADELKEKAGIYLPGMAAPSQEETQEIVSVAEEAEEETLWAEEESEPVGDGHEEEEDFHPAGPEEEFHPAGPEEEYHPAGMDKEEYHPAPEEDEFSPFDDEERASEKVDDTILEDTRAEGVRGGKEMAFTQYGKTDNKKKIFVFAGIAALLLIGAVAGYFFFLTGEETVLQQASAPNPAVTEAKPSETPPPAAVEQAAPAAKPAQAAQSPAAAPVEAKPAPEKPKTEEAVEKPVKKTVKAAKAKRVYSVQLGSFSDRANAVRLMGIMRQKGYKVFIEEGQTYGVPVFRVLAGKFPKKDAASRLSAAIMNKEGIETSVFSEWGM